MEEKAKEQNQATTENPSMVNTFTCVGRRHVT